MSKKDGKPCKRCGTSKWNGSGHCVACNRERQRRYRGENRDKTAAYNRQYRATNRDKVAELQRRWREANPDKAREGTRLWAKKNPEKEKAKQNRRRAWKTEAGGSFTAAEWKALCRQYDNHCCYPGCKRTDIEADHITPISKGGSSDIGNIQPLCRHHNSSKGSKTIDYRPEKGGFMRWIQKQLFD